MADQKAIEARLRELAERKWEIPAIEARCRALFESGSSRRKLDRAAILEDRNRVLDRIQRLAEEYNYYAGNCARGTVLALMEEFGFGSREVVKALSPFPGFAGSGWMCGAVTGGLAAIGLFGGSEDPGNYEAMGFTMKLGKQFMERFGKEVGAYTCPKIQEDLVFGRYMDPGASPENMKAFEQAKGFEKCSLLPGIGARIAAEIIIDHL